MSLRDWDTDTRRPTRDRRQSSIVVYQESSESGSDSEESYSEGDDYFPTKAARTKAARAQQQKQQAKAADLERELPPRFPTTFTNYLAPIETQYIPAVFPANSELNSDDQRLQQTPVPLKCCNTGRYFLVTATYARGIIESHRQRLSGDEENIRKKYPPQLPVIDGGYIRYYAKEHGELVVKTSPYAHPYFSKLHSIEIQEYNAKQQLVYDTMISRLVEQDKRQAMQDGPLFDSTTAPQDAFISPSSMPPSLVQPYLEQCNMSHSELLTHFKTLSLGVDVHDFNPALLQETQWNPQGYNEGDIEEGCVIGGMHKLSEPWSYHRLGLDSFNELQYYEMFHVDGWTLGETIALLDFVSRYHLDSWALTTQDPILSVRHTPNDCQTRMLQILSSASVNGFLLQHKELVLTQYGMEQQQQNLSHHDASRLVHQQGGLQPENVSTRTTRQGETVPLPTPSSLNNRIGVSIPSRPDLSLHAKITLPVEVDETYLPTTVPFPLPPRMLYEYRPQTGDDGVDLLKTFSTLFNFQDSSSSSGAAAARAESTSSSEKSSESMDDGDITADKTTSLSTDSSQGQGAASPPPRSSANDAPSEVLNLSELLFTPPHTDMSKITLISNTKVRYSKGYLQLKESTAGDSTSSAAHGQPQTGGPGMASNGRAKGPRASFAFNGQSERRSGRQHDRAQPTPKTTVITTKSGRKKYVYRDSDEDDMYISDDSEDDNDDDDDLPSRRKPANKNKRAPVVKSTRRSQRQQEMQAEEDVSGDQNDDSHDMKDDDAAADDVDDDDESQYLLDNVEDDDDHVIYHRIDKLLAMREVKKHVKWFLYGEELTEPRLTQMTHEMELDAKNPAALVDLQDERTYYIYMTTIHECVDDFEPRDDFTLRGYHPEIAEEYADAMDNSEPDTKSGSSSTTDNLPATAIKDELQQQDIVKVEGDHVQHQAVTAETPGLASAGVDLKPGDETSIVKAEEKDHGMLDEAESIAQSMPTTTTTAASVSNVKQQPAADESKTSYAIRQEKQRRGTQFKRLEYLVKEVDRSYRNCRWFSEKQLCDRYGAKLASDRVKRFIQKREKIEAENLDKYGGHPYDQRFEEIDRIIGSEMHIFTDDDLLDDKIDPKKVDCFKIPKYALITYKTPTQIEIVKQFTREEAEAYWAEQDAKEEEESGDEPAKRGGRNHHQDDISDARAQMLKRNNIMKRYGYSECVDYTRYGLVCYFVKWSGQGYGAATWEKGCTLHDEMHIAQFMRFSRIPPLVTKILTTENQRTRALRENNWYQGSPQFKSGNQLRDYQIHGVNWLISCFLKRKNAILADEMGLGKTVQCIAFLEHLRREENIRGPFLIVAPLSTLPNWKRESEQWTDMNVVLYHDASSGAQGRQIIRDYEFFFPNGMIKFNILITSYEMLLSDQQELAKCNFQYVIIDEGHRLKNKTAKLMDAFHYLQIERRLLLTGTPIQNNMTELWTLLNFLEPHVFSDMEGFQRKFGHLSEANQVEELQRTIKPYILRRMKETVEKSIPSKEETVINVELTTIQKKYYRAIYERNIKFLKQGVTTTNTPKLINIEAELRKCCNHPWLVAGAEEKEVPPSFTEQEYFNATIQASGKLVLLDKLLPKLFEEGHRVLIFSQMVILLDILSDYLKFRGYKYERLDGSVTGDQRDAAIDRFCRPDSDRFIFLLSTRAGGVGLNLTSADTVIIYDSDWNPQQDVQAQARAHRIGQKNNVRIYRLVTRNTYESEMFTRASKKLGLDHVVLKKLESGKRGGSEGKDSQEDIARILRLGAYGLLDDDENDEQRKTFFEADINQILEQNTYVIGNKPADGSSADATAGMNLDGGMDANSNPTRKAVLGGLVYSKQYFSSEDSEMSQLQVDDENFWTRVLATSQSEYKYTPDALLSRLTDSSASASSASKQEYFDDLKTGYELLLKRREEGSDDITEIDEMTTLLLQYISLSTFPSEHRQQAQEWIHSLEASMVRRRGVVRYNDDDIYAGRFDDHDDDDDDDDSDDAYVEAKRPKPKGRGGRESYIDPTMLRDDSFVLAERAGLYGNLYVDVGKRGRGARPLVNANVCNVCYCPGNLIACDGPCQRTFHVECVPVGPPKPGTLSDLPNRFQPYLPCYCPPDEVPPTLGAANNILIEKNKPTFYDDNKDYIPPPSEDPYKYQPNPKNLKQLVIQQQQLQDKSLNPDEIRKVDPQPWYCAECQNRCWRCTECGLPVFLHNIFTGDDEGQENLTPEETDAIVQKNKKRSLRTARDGEAIFCTQHGCGRVTHVGCVKANEVQHYRAQNRLVYRCSGHTCISCSGTQIQQLRPALRAELEEKIRQQKEKAKKDAQENGEDTMDDQEAPTEVEHEHEHKPPQPNTKGKKTQEKYSQVLNTTMHCISCSNAYHIRCLQDNPDVIRLTKKYILCQPCTILAREDHLLGKRVIFFAENPYNIPLIKDRLNPSARRRSTSARKKKGDDDDDDGDGDDGNMSDSNEGDEDDSVSHSTSSRSRRSRSTSRKTTSSRSNRRSSRDDDDDDDNDDEGDGDGDGDAQNHDHAAESNDSDGNSSQDDHNESDTETEFAPRNRSSAKPKRVAKTQRTPAQSKRKRS